MSRLTTQRRAAKTRDYRLGKRALQQEETRRRIVDAAVDLHGTLGPAHTSISQIAQRAGVQRHTVYAHFSDERSLFLACSARSIERDPLPQPDRWQSLPRGSERLREGLKEIYSWFDRNEELAACVLRDAEQHALTREMVELRLQPFFDRASQRLGEGLTGPARALLSVALDFACWRALSRTSKPDGAARLMTDAICGLDGG